MSFDKYKSCKDIKTGMDCPDRCVGCHGTCDGYKFRCEEQQRINDSRRSSKPAPTAQREKASMNIYKKQEKLKIYKR
jgi:hypothetical protein